MAVPLATVSAKTAPGEEMEEAGYAARRSGELVISWNRRNRSAISMDSGFIVRKKVRTSFTAVRGRRAILVLPSPRFDGVVVGRRGWPSRKKRVW